MAEVCRWKQLVSITIIGLIVCMALATGIGGAAKEYRINIATATTGGVYYPLGNAFAQVWTKNLPGVRASAQATAGTPQNIQLMGTKEAHIAFGQNGVCYCAYYGTMQYDGNPQKFIRGMTYLYPNVMHFVARKGSGVKSVADLKGKKFVPGAVASATEINGREILSIYNLNYMKDKGEVNVKADFVGYNEAADLIKNNQTDVSLIAGGIPTAAVMDMFASAHVELINIEEDKIKDLQKEYPWYFPIIVPKGTYPGQSEDVLTVAVANILVCTDDLPDDLVYTLVKTLYDKHDDLVAAHMAAKDMKIEDGMKGMIIPIHPGAAKFFEENGVKLPDVKM
jgi:TRAP transporter TAXI family solute receptor